MRNGRRSLLSALGLSISAVIALGPALAAQGATTDDPGDIWGWGRNDYGPIGTGESDVNVFSPVKSLYTDVTAISAGSHTLAVRSDGTAWASGDNTNGELGDGTKHGRLSPVQVVGLENVVAVDAGSRHSLAIRASGRVWAWGDNKYGQLGDDSVIDRLTPVRVLKLRDVIAISAGPDFSLALKANGNVKAWGNNNDGEIGDGTTAQRLTPVRVPGLTDVTGISAGGNFDNGSLLTPLSFSLAVDAGGTAWAWGNNESGQLGDGTITDRLSPTQILGLDDEVAAVSAGGHHSLGLRADGTVWAWGDNFYGQLGDGTQGDSRTPQRVPDLDSVTAVSAGFDHSLGLRSDGTGWGWGDNDYGAVGNGTTDKKVLAATQVADLVGITSLDAGLEHSLAIVAAAG